MLSYAIIGRNIKAARKRAKMTQAQVANKMNISVCYYGKLERGEVKQCLERLAGISTLLSTPIEVLMENAMGSPKSTACPASDEIERNIERIVCRCSQQRRVLMLDFCEAVSQLK